MIVNIIPESAKNVVDINYSVDASYEVRSDAKIGEIKSRREVMGDGVDYIVKVTDCLSIQIKGFLRSYSLLSNEVIELNQTGVFHYKGDYIEDGKTSNLTACVIDGVLSVHASGSEDARFNLSVNDYDATSEDASRVFICSGEASKTLKVLDFDDFEIKHMTYTNLGKHSIQIANSHFESYRITFASQEKVGEQWVVEDDSGVWLLKETREDSDGKFTTVLTQYRSNHVNKDIKK